MHVVFVTNKLVNGGGERVLAQLISGLCAAGGRASILFLGKGSAIVPAIKAEMEAAGAEVILPSTPLVALGVLRTATTLHLYNVNVYVKALPILPLFRQRRVICHVHGAAESANPLARRLFRASWNPCDEIVFVSDAGRTSWAIPRGQVVANPVTFPPRRKARAPMVSGHLRLISVNRLVPVKRVASQLDILARLRSKHGLDATLDIVGEGPDRAALEEKLTALGLVGAVRFLGGLAHEEVLSLYQNYDGFLATSAAEGLGLSLIEAIAAGLPSFAAPIPPFREVANVAGGALFIDPEVSTEAAATIAEAYSTPSQPKADPAALKATFDPTFFVARLLGLYQ